MIASGAVDDSATIRSGDVEAVVRKLCVSYHFARRSFNKYERKINTLIDSGDVTGAIQLMTNVYRLPSGFVRRVGYSAKIPAPAALNTKTALFTDDAITSTVYFRSSKADLQKMSRYLFLHMVGHELAHARMNRDKHVLSQSEFATDVLAVLVTGNSRGYTEAMVSDTVRFGYIRRELLPEVFRCLGLYADRIYL